MTMSNNYAFKVIALILLIGQLQFMFHMMCELPVYLREINKCVMFIILKTLIFLPHVAK